MDTGRELKRKLLVEASLYADKRCRSGHTLLEALVSLSIFLLVVVPLLGRVTTGTGMTKAQDALVAASLIEQAAVAVELYPNEVKPVEKRRLGPREYQIRISRSGSGLNKYRVRISSGGDVVGEAVIYRMERP
ncbi:MAG: hypothetical protein GF344_01990 [Chitinivibrionales bacterium]|nr:hypothetical protein [Chitinivibrionales bacterium]MBD3355866.1 hypothetical protein [Chitinivibrionales bacterium]